MASSSQESGPLTDLAHQASRKGGEVAHWLQDREPADVLEAVRSYARRRPVTFLALCGLAGIVAGRLTRSTVATRTSLDTKDNGGVRSAPDSCAAPTSRPAGDRRRLEPAPVLDRCLRRLGRDHRSGGPVRRRPVRTVRCRAPATSAPVDPTRVVTRADELGRS